MNKAVAAGSANAGATHAAVAARSGSEGIDGPLASRLARISRPISSFKPKKLSSAAASTASKP